MSKPARASYYDVWLCGESDGKYVKTRVYHMSEKSDHPYWAVGVVLSRLYIAISTPSADGSVVADRFLT